APVGERLDQRYAELDRALRPCSVTRVTDVSVEHAPVCAECKLPLTEGPPSGEAHALLRDLNQALDARRRQLASEAISRVLARGGRDDMATFLEAVRAADLAALVDVMSP